MLALTAFSGNAHAAKLSERAKQKSLAEAERADLQHKLAALKSDISRTEVLKDNAADTLAESEAAISDANRSLHELVQEQGQTQTKLSALAAEQSTLAATVDTQQKHLTKLMREQYVAGNEDRIKLLLSGDNPNRINRDMQYLGYVSQAQARLISALRANLQAVDRNKAEAQNAKDALDEIAQEERQQKAVLVKEQAKRAALLSQLSNKLVLQRKQAGNLERDEQRLGGLVEKLAVLIEEQKKADALALEKRRAEQLAAAKAERERIAKLKADKAEQDKRRALQAKNAVPNALPPRASNPPVSSASASAKTAAHNPDAIDADEPPPSVLAKAEIKNELVPSAAMPDGVFASLRGQLRLPVRGTVAGTFGSKRGDGPSLKGLFIRAAEGTDIKAVAQGRVIFSDWLRGFGNLIIVDHGSQYMTIYGNNQTLMKRPGDAVKAGDVIASAGNSGGNEQSGLYFEIRHQGRAFDPLGWVTIR
ncbi:MAG: peptidoglycan DD-metalloendopeptidase family protein [Pseudomonadota bacterium]